MRERSKELRDLNMAVTSAILDAEHMRPGPEQRAAFRVVCDLEMAIAAITAPDDIEGEIARRGAVTAAMSAKDWSRAADLVHRYIGEPVPQALAVQLTDILMRDGAP